MPSKANIKEIRLVRAEGPSIECGKPRVASCFFDADLILRQWSYTAPEEGGYDKCYVEIEWENDTVYRLRCDLKHWRIEAPNLLEAVVSSVKFWTGICPAHMTQERYDALVKNPSYADAVAFFKHVEETCNIQDMTMTPSANDEGNFAPDGVSKE